MALLEIVKYPEPVLHRVGKPVERFDDELKKLVADMFETMYAAKGVGLAAPQVNVSQRLFVMDVPDEAGKSNQVVAVNPEVVFVEGEQIGDEGCLSFPSIYVPIQRNQRAVLRAQDAAGDWFELDGEDLTARCILHETDHCDGIVFLNRMTTLKREMAKRKIKRLQKTGKWE